MQHYASAQRLHFRSLPLTYEATRSRNIHGPKNMGDYAQYKQSENNGNEPPDIYLLYNPTTAPVSAHLQ
ncbi:hypothetical protein AcV7_010032 [Taiwanofungus camphoratus]|nr:hypothetical protein AcV7_010032 [Antrodia cinnamomea]